MSELPAPALGDRQWFPTLEPWAYLNHAAVSPPSVRVQEAVAEVLALSAAKGLGAFPATMARLEHLRAHLAGLFGGLPRSYALTAGTTRGIIDIAFCMPWKPGDHIVCFQGEFPSNVTPWQQAAQTFDLRVDWLPLRGFDDGSGAGLQRLEDRLSRGGVRMVAVSAVQFQTGLRMPLRAMAELCHSFGAQLFVDAIQACGAVPLDVGACEIDYLACGAHKWCMGVEGCGFLYVHPSRVGDLVPRLAGWLSHEDGMRFLTDGAGHLKYGRPIRARADFLEPGVWQSAAFAALDAGLRPIADLSVVAIYAHISAYLDRLEEGLVARGFASERAKDPRARSGILAVRPPEGTDLIAWQGALMDRGVSSATPDGRLRFAPHWPNALDEVDRVLEVVDAIAAGEAVQDGA